MSPSAQTRCSSVIPHAAEVSPAHSNFQQPLPILLQSFKPYAPELNEDYFFVNNHHPVIRALSLADPACTQRLIPYFTRVAVPRGTSLWSVGEEPDA